MSLQAPLETERSLTALRDQLDGLYRLLDGATHSLDQAGRQATEARSTLAGVESAIAAAQATIASQVKPLDDTATVMQRELSHLAGGLADTPRSITTVLRLSVRLATTLFSVEQLRELEADPTAPQRIDLLRSGWQRWLGELHAYLAEALPLARRLAELQGGPTAVSYNATLQTLATLGGSLAPVATPAPTLDASEPLAAPSMGRLKNGPLGGLLIVPPPGEEPRNDSVA